ncbi:hypothetical protein K1X76_07455 [bacterium]|nr:hypothetical protein [bacterium]
MKNKTVTINLNTPLAKINVDNDELIIQIQGKVISTDDGGLTVEIKTVSNGKKWFSTSQFKEIFIPMSKVDFVVLS